MERADALPVPSLRAPICVSTPAGSLGHGWGEFQLLAAVEGYPLGQLSCSWREHRSFYLGRVALLGLGAIRVSLVRDPRAVLAAFGDALAAGLHARAPREPCVAWCVRGHPFHAPVLHALAARADPSQHEYTPLGVCVARELADLARDLLGPRPPSLALRFFL